MKKTDLILLIFTFTLALVGCKENKKEANTNVTIEAGSYEIIKVKDLSRKAFGKKSFSDYKTSEIKNLPINKKMRYKVVFSDDIKQNQVKPTIKEIVDQLTTDDEDIDEIILWIYSSKEVLNNPYDIGTAIWAPNGKLGNIDAQIAKNNNRKSYKIEYEIKENLEEYLSQKSKSETKFGFTEDERKQIYKDIVSSEEIANEYERTEQDKILDRILEKYGKLDDNSQKELKIEYNKISEKAEEIMTEKKSKVFEKYEITEEQVKEISTEAFNENWPME